MVRYLTAILLLFAIGATAQNTDTLFRAEYNYLASITPTNGGTYGMRGLFTADDNIGFTADSIAVGDYFIDLDGDIYQIVFKSVVTSPLDLEVDLVRGSGAPTTGIGLLTQTTINKSFYLETSGITDKLRALNEVLFRAMVDSTENLTVYGEGVQIVNDTVTLDINGLTALGNGDPADYIAVWDADQSEHKKISLPSLNGGNTTVITSSTSSPALDTLRSYGLSNYALVSGGVSSSNATLVLPTPNETADHATIMVWSIDNSNSWDNYIRSSNSIRVNGVTYDSIRMEHGRAMQLTATNGDGGSDFWVVSADNGSRVVALDTLTNGQDLTISQYKMESIVGYTILARQQSGIPASDISITLPSPSVNYKDAIVTVVAEDADATFNITIDAGANEIWEAGSLTGSSTVSDGSVVDVVISYYPDGTYKWVIK